MALSQAASLLEKVIGHNDSAITEQDVTNPARDRTKYADPSGEMMMALVWRGKNSVAVGNDDSSVTWLSSVVYSQCASSKKKYQNHESWRNEMSS